MRVPIGELTNFGNYREKNEEEDIRKEIFQHSCPRCVIAKRTEKHKASIARGEGDLLSELQRKIYKEVSKRPHRCGID